MNEPAAPESAATVTPVTIVTGFPGSGKSTLIAHWLSQVRAPQRWAVLANGADALPISARARSEAGAPNVQLFELGGGCACCSAALMLQATLISTLRQGPWTRVIIELGGNGLPSAVIDRLRNSRLDTHLAIEQVVAVQDAGLVHEVFGEDAPELSLELVRAQLQASSVVVGNRALPEQWPAFERWVGQQSDRAPVQRAIIDGGRAPLDWPTMIRQAGPERGTQEMLEALVGGFSGRPPKGPPGAPAGQRLALAGGGWAIRQRWAGRVVVGAWWPPSARFDRRLLREVAREVAGLHGFDRLSGVFGSERDWLAVQLTQAMVNDRSHQAADGSGPSGAAKFVSTHYRLDHRFVGVFGDDPPADAHDLWLQALRST